MTSLLVLGGILWIGFLALIVLSNRFASRTPAQERPILEIVGLLVGLSLVYLVALWTAVRHPRQERIAGLVFTFALAFRILVLFSTPIQELDYYRYLWDGYTVLEGVSPYRYSPEQVLQADLGDAGLPPDLRRLAVLRESDPLAATIVSRVHHGDLPSIYPPVSLAVFALAATTIPPVAGMDEAVMVLKGWIVLFDLGTLWMMLRLLRRLQFPVGWSVAYGWCPLIVKEFANSGHLDAIAVFFLVVAAYAGVGALDFGPTPVSGSDAIKSRRGLASSAIALGLAIGAKLFPVVLVPLWGLTVWRKRGFRTVLRMSLLLGTIVVVTCGPMFWPAFNEADSWTTAGGTGDAMDRGVSPPVPTVRDPQPAGRSLKEFLSRWKMNDLLFLTVESNLAPCETTSHSPQPWFAVTPETWRTSVIDWGGLTFGWERAVVPFLLARVLTASLFIGLALRWAWRASRSESASDWLGAVFLTLAWFWVLSPTLNPWYWAWALPFVPFARCRSWLIVSGLLFLYYLRFWFAYHCEGVPVAGTPYEGELFFHYVIIWFEHFPWLAALLIESVLRRKR